jgi:ribosomal protein L11 methyltransferase
VRSESVDLLLCNLTADVIAALFSEIQRAVKTGGAVIFSGILVEQRTQIRNIVTRSGWAIEDDRTRGEWIALVVRKPYGH